jgi:hypothetical protein
MRSSLGINGPAFEAGGVMNLDHYLGVLTRTPGALPADGLSRPRPRGVHPSKTRSERPRRPGRHRSRSERRGDQLRSGRRRSRQRPQPRVSRRDWRATDHATGLACNSPHRGTAAPRHRGTGHLGTGRALSRAPDLTTSPRRPAAPLPKAGRTTEFNPPNMGGRPEFEDGSLTVEAFSARSL